MVLLKKKEIIGSKNTSIKEVKYNGNALLLKFNVYRDYGYDFKVLDMNANEKFNITMKMNKNEIFLAESLYPTSLFIVEDKGFISCDVIYEKDKFGYEITYISDTDPTIGWAFKSDSKEFNFQKALVIGNNDENLVLLVEKRKKKKSSSYLQALDANSGELKYDILISDEDYELNVLKAKVDKLKKYTYVVGQYYDSKYQKFLSSVSLGVFSIVIDENGKEVQRNFISWESDVSKFLKVNPKGKLDKLGYVHFHDVMKIESKYILVGETFQLPNAFTGVMVVEDLLFFEFDENFNLTNVRVYDKNKSSYAIDIENYYSSFLDAFDYSYCQTNSDNSVVTFSYIDFVKTGNGIKKPVFHAITYAEGEVTEDKIPLKWTRKNRTYILPAKTGYITMYDYDKKEKKIIIHTEKINY